VGPAGRCDGGDSMSANAPAGYAGDVSVKAAWEELSRTREAVLVDVRNMAEWTFVGVPVLTDVGKAPVLVAWDDYASGELVPDFIGRLAAELEKQETAKDAPLFFICRSGNRSRKAAIAATAAGYTRCYNLERGFEGRLGPDRHRGTAGSWKAEGLPWAQS
jgi:rhodanese-related sulfurtransferase